jgi:hypothetical protein
MYANTSPAMHGAASCNELAVVQFLHAQGCPLDNRVCNFAVTRGHTAMCAYLHNNDCPWDTMACSLAVSCGHCSTLRWLREHGCPWQDDYIHLAAAQGGSVNVMVYLQQQGIVYTAAKLKNMLDVAGACNQLAAAKWLRQQGAEWPEVLWSHAHWSGDVLEWARAEG